MKKLFYIYAMAALCIGCSEYPDPTSLAPDMTTGEVTDIYRTGATISGSFTEMQLSSGPVKECGVLLSIMQSMAEPDTLKALLVGSGEFFRVQARGLQPGMTYYYQSYAGSGVSIIRGSVKTFTTATQNPPIFSEGVKVAVDCKSASVVASIVDQGGSEINTKGFCWKLSTGSDDTPSITDNVMNIDIENSAGRIPNLIPNRDYVIRAYATNQSGLGYSRVLRIHTDDTDVPMMSSVTVVEQTNSSIEVTASMLSEGQSAVLEKGFCWGTSSEPTIDGVHKAVAGSSEIREQLMGIRPRVQYYLCAYATNARGTGYGDVYPFMLEETSKPMLSPLEIESYSGYAIALSASIIADGGEAIIEKGFCYSDLVMPTIDGTKVIIEGQSNASFQGVIANLTPASTYAIRAYAKNRHGVAYSKSVCVELLDEAHFNVVINPWNDEPAENGEMK